MSIFVEIETGKTLDLPVEEIANDVVEAALDYVHCPYECQVNLLLTDNESIRKMNVEFRTIDRATDVLSFPMVDYNIPGDFSFLEENTYYFEPESGELLLGDIVISVEKVKEQANSYGHSIRREFAFLIAHSMLHLFGYDHINEDERAVMDAMQEDILSGLNITRQGE